MGLKKFKLPILLSFLIAANAWYYTTLQNKGACDDPPLMAKNSLFHELILGNIESLRAYNTVSISE